MTQIDASENHPCVGGSGAQTQFYPLATVQANTNRAGKGLQSSLFKHASDFNQLVCARMPEFRSYPFHLRTWHPLWPQLVCGHVFATRWAH